MIRMAWDALVWFAKLADDVAGMALTVTMMLLAFVLGVATAILCLPLGVIAAILKRVADMRRPTVAEPARPAE